METHGGVVAPEDGGTKGGGRDCDDVKSIRVGEHARVSAEPQEAGGGEGCSFDSNPRARQRTGDYRCLHGESSPGINGW